MASDPIDPARVREAVDEVSKIASPFDSSWWELVRLVCAAARDSLTQRDTVQELSRAAAELKQEVDRLGRKLLADGTTLVASQREADQLRSELEAARAETERQRKNALNAADLVDARNELCTVLQRQLSTAQAEAKGLREALQQAEADLKLLDDAIEISDSSRGLFFEIRLELYADPEAELPSLPELLNRYRQANLEHDRD